MALVEAASGAFILNDYYHPRVSVVTPRSTFQSLTEFLEHGVAYNPAKRPYCIEAETKFAKLAHAADGFTGQNLAGQQNIRRETVSVCIGTEVISTTIAIQKNESLYTAAYGVISGEYNSIASIEGALYICSKMYPIGNGWAVQIARPVLFAHENVLDTQLGQYFSSSEQLADFTLKKITAALLRGV